jgi:hypothetical protein
LGPLDTAPRQSGKGHVLMEDAGVAQTVLPPRREFAHLQIGNGAKFVRALRSATVLLASVEKAACGDDACGQDDKNQEQNR